MSTYKGIDVSVWQGCDIDFAKVKASGINFVILRAGLGKYASQEDTTFEINYKKAKSAGLNVGAYWYSYAVSAAEAKQEAAACISVIKGKTFEYPIYFDLERQEQFNKGKTFCSSLVTTFCNELEKAGYWAGLYISRSPLQSYITDAVAKRYALWIAEYNSKCNYSGDYGIWQYSSTGKVNGISGNVDCDNSYVDYPAKIKAKGLNGFKKSGSTTTTTKPAASTSKNMTFDEFVKSYCNSRIDYDGYAGVQCVDLARMFSVKVLGEDMGATATGYAEGYFTKPTAQVKKLFTLIKNTPDFVPKKSDLMVWGASLNGAAGHIAICTGEGDTSYFYSYDYNWKGQNDGWTKVKHDYNHVLGVLRPKEQSNTNSSTTVPATVIPAETLMTYKVNATGLRYRAEPSIKAKACGTFKNGQSIKVVKGWGRTASGYIWYKTKISGKYYYVAAKYLKYVSG